MSELDGVIAAVAALLGVAVGSFLNVVAHRVPLGTSLSRPPSSCPGCDTPISPRDNIPLISWILLRARCRTCRMRISARYPALEALNGVLWAGAAVLVGPSWLLPAVLWFLSVTLALIATDLEHHRLPNRIVLHGTWVGWVLLAPGVLLDGLEPVRLLHALAGGVAWFGLLLAIALIARGGFGFGDVKLAFLLGSFVGLQPMLGSAAWFDALGGVAVAIFLAFFIGGAIAIALLVARRVDRRREIAFGPAMIVASWVAVACGDRLLDAWLA